MAEVNAVKEVEETGTVVCNRTKYRFLNGGFEVFDFEPEVRCLCLVCLKPLSQVKYNWRIVITQLHTHKQYQMLV